MAMKKKDKVPNSIRTYDKDGFRRRAACVCVRDENESDVLLVSRTRCDNEWIFPGGGIEPCEDPRQAASREVVEEAGVIGSIVRCLGIFESGRTRTYVYVLQVSNELAEWDDSIRCGRKRMWVSVEEAELALGQDHAQVCYLYRLKSPPSSSIHGAQNSSICREYQANNNNNNNNNNNVSHSLSFCNATGNRLTVDSANFVLAGDDPSPSRSSTDLTVERHDDSCCLAKCQNGSGSRRLFIEAPKKSISAPGRTLEKISLSLDSNPSIDNDDTTIDDFRQQNNSNSTKESVPSGLH